MADPLGVSVAFDAGPFVADPAWTRLDTTAGLRVQSWTVDRGRASEYDKTGTGTATIQIIDREGLLDPTNSGSPWFGKIQPHKQAAIALRDPVLDTWHTVFRGFVEDWSYELPRSKTHLIVELQLVDAFAIFSNQELRPGVDGDPLPSDDTVAAGSVYYTDGTVQDRLLALLDDAGWDAALTQINTGNVRLAPKVMGPGTPVLSAMQEAADGEYPGLANLYMSADGVVTFKGRQPRFRPDVAEYGINERDVGDIAVDADVAPISELVWNRGNANVRNAVTATPEWIHLAGTTAPTKYRAPEQDELDGQLVTDPTSIGLYGRLSESFDNLGTVEGLATGNTALEETLLFAYDWVTNRKDPQNRVSRMTFRSRALHHVNAAATWRMLTRAELSDKLNLKSEHPGGGGFDEAFYIEGLHYVVRPGNPDIPVVTLNVDVSPAAWYTSNPFDADEDPGAAP